MYQKVKKFTYPAQLSSGVTRLSYPAQLPGLFTQWCYPAQLPGSVTRLSYPAQLPGVQVLSVQETNRKTVLTTRQVTRFATLS